MVNKNKFNDMEINERERERVLMHVLKLLLFQRKNLNYKC